MAISGDMVKRQMWTARFARYLTSGLSVARFCKQEQVSPNTFYYWAKRLRTACAPSRTERAVAPRRASATSIADGNMPEAVVRFRWRSGTEVVVPADCLGVIRLLAARLAETGGRRGEAFQEVVVKV